MGAILGLGVFGERVLTLRFGLALYLLGRINPSILRIYPNRPMTD
jgi:hypothetical protein